MSDEQWSDLARQLINAVQANAVPTVADWTSAMATTLTLVIAVLALFLAKGQLDEASKARELTKTLEREKSQPYVVAYLEENAASPHILDLVVKNFGQTAGRNIRLLFNPTLNRTKTDGGDEKVALPDMISFLAPGQEWRTVFDVMNERAGRDDMPIIYKGMVSYDGLDGEAQSSDVVIDLRPYKTRMYVEILGIHHAATALRDIRDTHKKWNEPVNGGLKVVTRSGQAMDAARARNFRAYQEGRAAKSKPAESASSDPGETLDQPSEESTE
jgi:hypothetical protein